MALFNKLFTSRKKHPSKTPEHVCDKLFVFTTEQIRVVVFRECDFRGRKLLFDSESVERTPLPINKDVTVDCNTKKFIEVTNGYGYTYKKPNDDITQLREVVFGSVAMSYRGTAYKICSLQEPSRLLCTQVFPSPKYVPRLRSSAPSQVNTSSTVSSFEHSMRFEDSGASSATCSDQSVQSAASDTLLVCRRQRSIPLDVPVNSSLISSSGYGHSYSSVSSGPQSIPIDLGNSQIFSSGSLNKRWLRNTNTSLEQSSSSVTCSISTDDSFPKGNNRSSKIGLVVIIELSEGQEIQLERYLMDHAAVIESILWKIRQGVESAYIRHNMFVSLMYEIATNTAQWFVDFLTGVYLSSYFWNNIVSNCDNMYSIKPKLASINIGHLTQLNLKDTERTLKASGCMKFSGSTSSLLSSFKSEISNSSDSSSDYTFLNLSRFLKSERDLFNNNKKIANEDGVAERYLKELCELLEAVDVKHTNFFVSTLVTAVLTHHLGWVTTALPLTLNDKEAITKLKNSCKPLWGQLNDLYGAIGYPTKMSYTIVTGKNKSELITKILNSLTYFIRCTNVKRKLLSRIDIDRENKEVDMICEKNSCIPKENYKKYEDHLREIAESSSKFEFSKCEGKKNINFNTVKPKKTMGLTKTNSCVMNLNKLCSDAEYKPYDEFYNKVTTVGLNIIDSRNNEIYRTDLEKQNLVDIHEAKMQIDRVFQTKKFKSFDLNDSIDETKEVLFVLGDNDHLIGLKNKSEMKRPNKLNLKTTNESSFKAKFYEDSESSPDEALSKVEDTIKKNTNEIDFIKKLDLKTSSSFTSLDFMEKSLIQGSSSAVNVPKEVVRAQSEPRDPKTIKPIKYRHTAYKFNLKQYPQIVKNYMRSKSIELSNMQLADKEFEFDKLFLNSTFDFSKYEEEFDEEPLQTPSNASELEFTSDLVIERPKIQKAKENVQPLLKPTEFIRTNAANTHVKNEFTDLPKRIKEMTNTKKSEEKVSSNLKIIELPMPKSVELPEDSTISINYSNSLMRGVNERYISSMVLQGTAADKKQWESDLKKDLILSARHPLLDQPIDESIAIVANVDTWEVQLMSSHTYVIDKNTSGVTVGMSQLVANMLETVLHMWKLQTPAEYVCISLCIMHIEERLQEFCIRSKALAQLLLETDFCSMDLLTSTLHLEVNDIPLLMAVASTHTPQVTQKYGLSFQ